MLIATCASSKLHTPKFNLGPNRITDLTEKTLETAAKLYCFCKLSRKTTSIKIELLRVVSMNLFIWLFHGLYLLNSASRIILEACVFEWKLIWLLLLRYAKACCRGHCEFGKYWHWFFVISDIGKYNIRSRKLLFTLKGGVSN